MTFPPIKGSAGAKITIGLVASVVVVIGGFLVIQNIITKASDTAPRDVIISGIATNTAKITWTTDQETQGVVEYGSSPTALNLFAPESQKTKSHSVDITLLSPATSYYFQVRIGETKFDNGGVPWTFSTKAQQNTVTSVPTSPATSSAALITAIPTAVPTSGSAFGPLKSSSLKVNSTATPTQSFITVPTSTPAPVLTSFYCVETNCQQICLKINQGQCSTYDFIKPGGVYANNCTGKVALGTCFYITPTPTWNPLSPTPTPTLTPAPISPTSSIPNYMN